MVGLLQDQMESDGYICIPASLVWGTLGYLGIRWGNRFAIIVFKMLPLFLMKILVLVLLGILIVDILGSYLLLRGKGKNRRVGKLRMRDWTESVISLVV